MGQNSEEMLSGLGENCRMDVNKNYLVHTEEELNTVQCIIQRGEDSNDRIHKYKKNIEKDLKRMERAFSDELTFYQEVCQDIRKIISPSFLKPPEKVKAKAEDADIDAPKFYFYAYIDKNTWNHMKNNKKGISKESALKLVIALQVTEEDANTLLRKISFVLNLADYRDQIVIALLNSHCYDPDQASEVLEWYSKNGKYKFMNIYDV